MPNAFFLVFGFIFKWEGEASISRAGAGALGD